MNKWKEIWEKRIANDNALLGNKEEVLLELKRINGFDSTDNILSYDSFYDQYIQTKRELSFGAKKDFILQSIFEVGCGSGANLYLFQQDGIEVGGVDYSASLIETVSKILGKNNALVCDEAINMPCDKKYDAILSNSVFSYFPSNEYALNVLENMYVKSNYSIGILDVHDVHKKEDFMNYRMETVKNYQEKYKDLQNTFMIENFF